MDIKISKWMRTDMIVCIVLSILLLIQLVGVEKIYSVFCSFKNGNTIIRNERIFDISASDWYIARELDHSYILKSITGKRSSISITVFKQNNFFPSAIYNFWDTCKSLNTYKKNDVQKIITCIPDIESTSREVGMAVLNDKDQLIAMTMEYNPNQNNSYASLLELLEQQDHR